MAKLNRRDYYSAIPQLEGTITSLTDYITVSEGKIQSKIEDLYGNVSTLTETATSIEGRVEDAEGDIASLELTAQGLDVEISTKRRVFTSTPTVPYDVGDLWAQGDEGDIYYCVTAKTSSGTYSASDWDLASKYTDDTQALLEATARKTLIRDKDGGTITAYVGQTYGVYTNALGSVDIVTLSWDADGNPTVTGTIVSYGDSISFDDSLEFTIGNASRYLKWYDSDNDNVADSLAIIVDSLYIGSSEALKNGDRVSKLLNDGTYATGVMRSITTTTRSVDYSTALSYVGTNPDTWGSVSDIGSGTWNAGDFVKIPLTITDRDNASAYIMCRIIDYDGSTVSTYNLSLEMDAPASKYVTEISGYSGVTVHDSGDTSNFAQVTSTGLNVYVSNTKVASFGATTTIGNTSGTYWEFTSGGLFWYHNGETETPDIALSDMNGVYTVVAPSIDASEVECDNLYLANPGTFLVLDTTSISFTLTISSGDEVGPTAVTATKSGHYPIAIAGYNTGGPNAYFSQLRITSASSGSVTVTYRAKNVKSSQFSQTANIDILWVRIGDGT